MRISDTFEYNDGSHYLDQNRYSTLHQKLICWRYGKKNGEDIYKYYIKRRSYDKVSKIGGGDEW